MSNFRPKLANMVNSLLVFAFSFQPKIPFQGKLGPKTHTCLVNMTLGAKTNPNTLNLIDSDVHLN